MSNARLALVVVCFALAALACLLVGYRIGAASVGCDAPMPQEIKEGLLPPRPGCPWGTPKR